MTDEEVMQKLKSDTPLNRARAIFSAECAKIEQASQQRQIPSAIEIRRMEFLAVKKIVNAMYGTDMNL